MKTRTVLHFCVGALCGTSAIGQVEVAKTALPEIAGARVTIPYSELKSLWEAAQPKPEKDTETAPPVKAVILSAEYDLTITKGKAILASRYRVQSLTDGWHLIPLLGGEARLEQAEAGTSGIIWRDNSYQLLTQGRGNREIELQFAVPRPESWSKGLRLVPGAAALNRLRISGVPEGKSVRIPGLAPTDTGDGVTTYHIPGGLKEVLLSLEKFRPQEIPKEIEPPVPSAWDIQSEVFVRYQEDRLFYETRIYCQADQGSGLGMDLLLPRNALAISLRGEDLGDWKLGPRDDGRRRIAVRWETRDVLDRTMELSYAVPQSPLATEWALKAPRVPEGNETKSLYAILPVDGLELTGQDLRDSVQSRRLPEWLRKKIGSNDFLTADAGAEYLLRSVWLPRLETAQALISAASYDTRLVSDGALLVHATYAISHQSPLAWRLDLPPDMDEILTCEINGSAAQPVKRGESQIEFTLSSPKDGATTVSFCYTARLDAMDPVSGRSELQLPKTELFIHELTWAMALPDDYTTTAIEGNLAIDRHSAGSDSNDKTRESGNLLRLKKELVRGEHPTVELYYERRGLGD